jgi:hypothetical protein
MRFWRFTARLSRQKRIASNATATRPEADVLKKRLANDKKAAMDGLMRSLNIFGP